MSDFPTEREVAQSEHLSPPLTGDNISAKRVANYEWDGANWQRKTYGGSVLTTQVDTSATPIYYVGEAQPGAATSDASWRIKAINTSISPITIQWADGGAFTQIWDNRAALVYS